MFRTVIERRRWVSSFSFSFVLHTCILQVAPIMLVLCIYYKQTLVVMCCSEPTVVSCFKTDSRKVHHKKPNDIAAVKFLLICRH